MSIWDKISDLWWRGHSSTHHNPELPDLTRMRRNIKKLRQDGRDDLADELQKIVDQEEGRHA